MCPMSNNIRKIKDYYNVAIPLEEDEGATEIIRIFVT